MSVNNLLDLNLFRFYRQTSSKGENRILQISSIRVMVNIQLKIRVRIRRMQKRKREGDEIIELAEEFLNKHTDSCIKGINHILSVDPSLNEIIECNPFTLFLKENEKDEMLNSYFTKLASSIIGQQISGNAAKNIKKRICDLFDGQFPDYKSLSLWLTDDTKKKLLKECGLSQRKLSYIESLTQYFFNKEDDIAELLSKEEDSIIVENLVSNVKGIGPWSAKMFLVTGLHRLNVFAADDLGVARGCSRYLIERPEILKQLQAKRTAIKKSKIKHKSFKWKIYDEDVVELCGKLFDPYRTLFMFILWRLSDTNVDVVMKNESEFISK